MKKLLFTFSALLLSVTSFAQTATDANVQTFTIDILEHAILEVATLTHDFDIIEPTIAGDLITIAAPAFSSYIRTSLMTATNFGSNGSLSVTMTDLPPGFLLKMSLEMPITTPVGAAGTITSAYDYSYALTGDYLYNNVPTQLIGTMGTHATRSAAADGFTARYMLGIDESSYSLIRQSQNNVELTYTLAN